MKGDCVWVIHTLNKSLHKCTKLARGQDGVEVKSVIDLVLVKEDILCYVQDVRAVRGMG